MIRESPMGRAYDGGMGYSAHAAVPDMLARSSNARCRDRGIRVLERLGSTPARISRHDDGGAP